jgi:CRISPR-associated protein Csm3
MQLKRKIIIEGKIKLLTGLHIGGTDQDIKIGGVDNPVIKTGDKPYIPGSSFKGKLRSLLEKRDGKKDVCVCGKCEICKLFGTSADKAQQPSRLIIRDSEPLIAKSEDEILTEVKFENVINRVSSKAEHPRQTERVPAGKEFGFQIIFNDYGEDKELFDLFKKGLQILENDYIGGSGTRGYGRVKFIDLNQKFIDLGENMDIEASEKRIDVSKIEDLKYN